MPHFIHFSVRRSCSVLHFLLGHTTVRLTPQLLQLLSRKVTALQLGQVILSEIPQVLQRFQLSSIGLRQPGHLNGPTGFALPQKGQTCESGGFNCLQYLQGCLYPGISWAPNSSCENKTRLNILLISFHGLSVPQLPMFCHALSRAEFRPAAFVLARDRFCMVEFLVAKCA